MQLTTHFTLAELTASAKARQLGINNTPAPELLRQFVGLMQDHSITVPGYMQTELDELVKVDRDPNAKTRESDK